MKNGKTSGIPAWKRGLMVGIFGLAAVGAAAGIRENREEVQSRGVLESKEMEETAKERKKIALTFDDGPHKIYTEELLDGLKERNVKATFFLLGSNLEGKEEIVKRMAEEGHLIGNHTYYHVDITKLEPEEACAEIQKTSEAITAITGQPVEYVRPPFGNWDSDLECDVTMIPIFWTVDTLDWASKDADQVVKKVLSTVEENDIILMHDSYESTVQATLRIVDELAEEGYEFVTVDELILD